MLVGMAACGGKQEQQASAGAPAQIEASTSPATSETSIVTATDSVMTPQRFCQQLEHDGALAATIDGEGYVVYTVDTKMDQMRPGDADRLARTVYDKAEAAGVKIPGTRVYDQFTSQVLSQYNPQ